MAGQRGLLLAVLRAVVCHGKAQAGGGADGLLVAEPGGIDLVAGLRTVSKGFGVHLRLCLYVDSLRAQSGHRRPPCRRAPALPGLRLCLPSDVQLLPALWSETGGWKT